MPRKPFVRPSALVTAMLAMMNRSMKEAPIGPQPIITHPGRREPQKRYTRKNKEESKIKRKMAAKSRKINRGK